MSERTIIQFILQGKDNVSGAVQSANQGLEGLNKTTKMLATAGLAMLAKKLVDVTTNMVKTGAESLMARDRLIAFAGGVAQADHMMNTIIQSSDGVIDRMNATAMASQLLELGLAQNAEEMGILSAGMARLGRASLSAEGRMNSLTLLLSNQSVMRLDDFGLSVERVTTRWRELEAQGQATEQAFKTAVMEAFEAKLAILGDTSDQLAVQADRLEASWKSLTQTWNESFAVLASGTPFLEALSNWLDRITERTLRVNAATELRRQLALDQRQAEAWVSRAHALNARAMAQEEAAAKSLTTARQSLYGAPSTVPGAVTWLRQYNIIAEIQRQEQMAQLQEDYQKRLDSIVRSGEQNRTQIVQEAHAERVRILQDAMQAELEALDRAIEERQFAQRMEDMLERHLDAMARIRDRYRQTEQQKEQERYRSVIDNLEAEQQKKLEALRAEYGKDREGGKDKETLEEEHRRRMMGLYTESARARERKRHAEALKELEYQEKEKGLLEQFQEEKRAAEEAHRARLEQIAERAMQEELRREEERYRKEVERAEKARAEQRADADERKRIEMQFAQEKAALDRQLAVELAGIQQQMIANQLAELDRWFNEQRNKINRGIDGINRDIENSPIKIPLVLSTSPIAGEHWETYLRRIGVPGFAYGGLHTGGLAIVGERGPEMLNLPSGTRITPGAAAPVYITNNFGQGSVRSDRDIRRIQEDQERSLRLRGLGAIA